MEKKSAMGGLDMNMPGFIGYGIGDQNQQDPAVSLLISLRTLNTHAL